MWKEDTSFIAAEYRYLALIKGKCDFDTGFTNTLLDTSHVIPGIDATYHFSIPSSKAADYTAFIFVDINPDGLYEDGYDTVSGYKSNRGEIGDVLYISVSAFY